MKFSTALDLVFEGKRLQRNGSDSFIFLVPGSTFTVNRPPLLGIYPEGTEINYSPHIDISENGNVSVWTPSHNDMMADDWEVVE